MDRPVKRLIAVAVTVALGAALGLSPARAVAASPGPVLATPAYALLTSDADSAIDIEIGITSCHGSSKTRTATLTYYDAVGDPLFSWSHQVTFYWNCTAVTNLSHKSWPTYYVPGYTFGGYLVNTISGVGTASAHAVAQGRIGVCQDDVVINGCVMEKDPLISWHLTATGGATPTYAQ